jgi:peptidoglycan/LPS O-acetylase OafA/YrhL
MPEAISKKRGHLPGIHGLRAIAAIGVMLFHICLVPSPSLSLPPVFDRIVPMGGMGVSLFFILSAFSLLYSHEGSSKGRGWIQIYLIKRIFRIAPLFWFMLVLYRILPVFQLPSNTIIFLKNIFFVYNFSPETYQSLVGAGWTLGVEMPFYLCVPIIILFVKTPRDAFIFFIVTVAITLASRHFLTLEYGQKNAYPSMAFLSNISVFSAGILTYHLVRIWGAHVMLWRVIGALGIAVFATLPLHLNLIPIHPSRPDIMVWTLALSAICAWQATAPSYLLSTKVMQWLGERSFGIYLIHPMVIFSCVRYGIYDSICAYLKPTIGAWSYLACVGVTAAVVMPCAALAYRLIEAPFQRYAKYLALRLYGPQQTIPLRRDLAHSATSGQLGDLPEDVAP